MGDTTPVHKHPTEELPVVELLLYRMKQVEKTCERASEQNGQILIVLNKIEVQMALGTQRFDLIEKAAANMETRLVNVENDKRGVAGIATGLGAMFAAIGSYFK